MTAVIERTPTLAPESEHVALHQIARMLETNSAADPLRIIGADGAQTPIPASLAEVLGQLVRYMAREQPVTLVAFSQELTTQQAADILNVSRPFLVKHLLDTGEIPYSMTGTHRRISFDALIAYKQRRDERRKSALRELSQFSQQQCLE